MAHKPDVLARSKEKPFCSSGAAGTPALHVITGIPVNISFGLESSKELEVMSQRAPSKYMPDL